MNGNRCLDVGCALHRAPEKFSSKTQDRDGFKGKQFKTSPPKTGRTPDTYFEKKHPWVSEVRAYANCFTAAWAVECSLQQSSLGQVETVSNSAYSGRGWYAAGSNAVQPMRKCTALLQGAKYIDRLKYQETQPTHKKGFQTSDFSRRDEFSMTFRTEQYRTLLKQVSTAISAHACVPVHLTTAQIGNCETRDMCSKISFAKACCRLFTCNKQSVTM